MCVQSMNRERVFLPGVFGCFQLCCLGAARSLLFDCLFVKLLYRVALRQLDTL
jgi:hypothetical protein